MPVKALEALRRSLELAPRNAQAAALNGFLLSGQNRTTEALEEFEHALTLDSALGNAWLGRGLCRIRKGQVAAGRGGPGSCRGAGAQPCVAAELPGQGLQRDRRLRARGARAAPGAPVRSRGSDEPALLGAAQSAAEPHQPSHPRTRTIRGAQRQPGGVSLADAAGSGCGGARGQPRQHLSRRRHGRRERARSRPGCELRLRQLLGALFPGQ